MKFEIHFSEYKTFAEKTSLTVGFTFEINDKILGVD